jgi:serine/threonine-protein phosphatase PGAM5
MDPNSARFGTLTALGRRQAKRVGRLLRPLPVTRLHCSDLPRARETAAIIHEGVPALGPFVSRRLRECMPGLPLSMLRKHAGDLDDLELLRRVRNNTRFKRIMEHQIARDMKREVAELSAAFSNGSRRADRAFAYYFKPARGSDKLDVVVCHGNLIRALFCRAMGVPPEYWLSMMPTHAGITVIGVESSRRVRPIAFNETLHLPPEMRTEF